MWRRGTHRKLKHHKKILQLECLILSLLSVVLYCEVMGLRWPNREAHREQPLSTPAFQRSQNSFWWAYRHPVIPQPTFWLMFQCSSDGKFPKAKLHRFEEFDLLFLQKMSTEKFHKKTGEHCAEAIWRLTSDIGKQQNYNWEYKLLFRELNQ